MNYWLPTFSGLPVPRRRIFTPHPLLSRFVAITVLLIVALGWLGWRLLEQDRALARQRTHDRLESSADLIAAGLLRAIADVGDTLARLVALEGNAASTSAERVAASLAPDALLIVAATDRFDAYPRGRLLYDPLPPTKSEPSAALFARGDSLEFRARDPSAATNVYQTLATSGDASVRAAALLRVGRTTRKANRIHLAASAYEEMAKLDGAMVNGVPASLVARAARVALWREVGDSGVLRREASELHAELHAARWRMPRSAFEFYDAEVSRALALPLAPHGDATFAARIALSDAATSLWTSWRADDGERFPSSGARTVHVADHPLLMVWSARGDRVAALIGGPQFLASAMLSVVSPLLDRQQVRLSLSDDENRLVLASHAANAGGSRVSRVSRGVSETRLPWTLHVASASSDTEGAGAAERRRLLIAGIVVAALLALFGTYAVSRAANRELSAAKLQSDFVAAVSHEFRTPLTSLRQLTELLAEGRVPSAERRAEYYEAIRSETARLHRFVEALLDFGRADAGVVERRMQAFDGVALVRDTVAEFGREVAGAAYTIVLTAPDDSCVVSGDAEALKRALWNLFDNAVKYSPDERSVQVHVSRDGATLIIRVRDRGLGIPADEQTKIFEKFRRGAVARERGIRGTGIGLAIVRQIAESHGGTVAVESAPGAGSTFTMVLPLRSASA